MIATMKKIIQVGAYPSLKHKQLKAYTLIGQCSVYFCPWVYTADVTSDTLLMMEHLY